jgi:hypothetical protein
MPHGQSGHSHWHICLLLFHRDTKASKRANHPPRDKNEFVTDD